MKTFYERHLPHILPPGEIIFFTFRLADSLPVEAVKRLREERDLAVQATLQSGPDAQEAVAALRKRYFGHFDKLLDQHAYGPTWLREPAVAALVTTEIHRLPELSAVVLAFCLMANHVHLLLQLPEKGVTGAQLMHRLKGRTAVAANKLLGRRGQAFWQHESYDHVVRHGEECQRIIDYIVHNPVKAGLVDEWQKWPHTYVGEALACPPSGPM